MFERSEPTPHYLLMTYGLSEIYYNENSHENEISKFGFELILRIDQIQIHNQNVKNLLNLTLNTTQYLSNKKLFK